jgi:hypothetical protein
MADTGKSDADSGAGAQVAAPRLPHASGPLRKATGYLGGGHLATAAALGLLGALLGTAVGLPLE